MFYNGMLFLVYISSAAGGCTCAMELHVDGCSRRLHLGASFPFSLGVGSIIAIFTLSVPSSLCFGGFSSGVFIRLRWRLYGRDALQFFSHAVHAAGVLVCISKINGE